MDENENKIEEVDINKIENAQELKEAYEKLVQQYKEVIKATPTVAKKAIERGFNNQVNNINQKYNDVKKSIQDKKTSIKESIQGTKNNIKESIQEARADIKNSIQDTRADIKKSIQETKTVVRESMQDAKANIKQGIQDTKVSFKQSIQNTKDDMEFIDIENYVNSTNLKQNVIEKNNQTKEWQSEHKDRNSVVVGAVGAVQKASTKTKSVIALRSNKDIYFRGKRSKISWR